MNLNKINLNLLKSLAVLIDECNVTKASAKLHVTQAAMSNTLNQCRELFGDPLFIRHAKGMIPTAKTIMLAPKIKQALATMEQVFEQDSFDPAKHEKTFRIAVSSYCEHIFMPKLIVYLIEHAPGIKISLTNLCTSSHADQALANDIDLVIGPLQTEVSYDCNELIVAYDKAVCIMNKNHHLADKKLTLSAYKNAKHVAINMEPKNRDSYIDIIMAEQQLTRDVVCMFTQFIPALLLIEQEKSLIGTFPNIICHNIVNDEAFVMKPPPFTIPTCVFKMRWHQRYNNDPAHTWLRQQINEKIQYRCKFTNEKT